MTLAQNWPNTAKSSWHCSFIRCVCHMTSTIAEQTNSPHKTWNVWSKYNPLYLRANSLPNKYQAIPLCSETNIESIKTSFRLTLQFWCFSLKWATNYVWEHISAAFPANETKTLRKSKTFTSINQWTVTQRKTTDLLTADLSVVKCWAVFSKGDSPVEST